MMTIEDLKEEIHNNLQNVDYEERSNYGIIDAISDAFIKYEAINKNSVINDVSDCFVYDSILLRRIGNEIEFESDSYEDGLSELPKDEIPSLIRWLQAQYNR